jgi:hypothetical protein
VQCKDTDGKYLRDITDVLDGRRENRHILCHPWAFAVEVEVYVAGDDESIRWLAEEYASELGFILNGDSQPGPDFSFLAWPAYFLSWPTYIFLFWPTYFSFQPTYFFLCRLSDFISAFSSQSMSAVYVRLLSRSV